MRLQNILMKVHKTLFLIALLLPLGTQACDLRVSHPAPSDISESSHLALALLQLSLSKTSRHVCLEPQTLNHTLARKTVSVEKGELRLLWAGSGPDIESRLRAIRLPIFRGLLGYRLMVIRDGEQSRFENVSTLEELKQFRAGVGQRWPDKAVLDSNNFEVSSSPYGDRLWPMLRQKRFDFMPWGIHQIWHRMREYGEGLVVEPNLLLAYPIVSYFYVREDDDELHSIIDEGMAAAIKDGSYDKLLFQSALIREAVKKGNLGQRRIISMHGPLDDQTHGLHLGFKSISPLELEENVKRYLNSGK